jgi:hypothetical protein
VSNIDDLKLLANLPLYVDNIPIYSPTLKDIASIGLERYQVLLSYITITKNKINESFRNDIDNNFDALIKLINNSPETLDYILVGLYFFTKIEFTPKVEHGDIIFINDKIVLYRGNYDSFIKYVNFANKVEEENIEEMDEFDRQVYEMEKKIQESQNKDVEQPTFKDLISIVANLDGNGLNIINVWDLNIYQFQEQLQRGLIKDNYKFNLQQILAGANPDNIKLESYLKKI